MSIVHPLIEYDVDEMANVDDEIIQHVEWDCNKVFDNERTIVYFLTRQSIELVASIANNATCVKFAHLHAHLDEDTNHMQFQS
jgi:hypothetical protein